MGLIQAPIKPNERKLTMQLRAWRTVCKNPCNDPTVFITIGPVLQTAGIWPWVMTERNAIDIFGQKVVDQVGEEPAPILLELKWEFPPTGD